MRPLEKDQVLRFIQKINSWKNVCEKRLRDARDYILHEYKFSNQASYLEQLDRCYVPSIFCIDIESAQITYMLHGVQKKVLKKSKKPFSYLPDKKSVGVITNIYALMSNKKQIACQTTAKKRRNSDGTYKGIDKTTQTKKDRNVIQQAAFKIAKARRLPDGTYKGIDKTVQTKKKNNVFYIAAKKTAKNRRMLDGTYRGATIPISEEMMKLALETRKLKYEYLGTGIKGSTQKVPFICNKGHSFTSSYGEIKKGTRCTVCVFFVQEKRCRDFVEDFTGYLFPKKRPEWLVNPTTERTLELDGFSEELKVAFEYDGPTHFFPIYGNDILRNSQYLDSIKDSECKKNGVSLVRIDFRHIDDIEYMKEKFKKWQKS